ncbi:post-transcriptional regulator [Bacillus atrophaeus]|uniref:post-transcriptional regulator n=1 Tax=Bacillus atrophaeus TaxID=1452 RepID=UPI0030F3BFE8
MDKHPAGIYKDHLRPFLYSKLEEFKILGYDDVELDSLWSYLLNKKWKKKTEKQIYELASDISSVKIGEFMNYATVESFKTSNWLGSEEGQEVLDELLK